MKGNLTEEEFELQQDLWKVDDKYRKQYDLLDKLEVDEKSFIRDGIWSSIRERHFEECNRLFIRYFSKEG